MECPSHVANRNISMLIITDFWKELRIFRGRAFHLCIVVDELCDFAADAEDQPHAFGDILVRILALENLLLAGLHQQVILLLHRQIANHHPENIQRGQALLSIEHIIFVIFHRSLRALCLC